MVNLLVLSLLTVFLAPLQGANSVFCAAAEYQQAPQNQQLAKDMSDDDDEDYDDDDDDDEDVIIMEEEVTEEKNS